MKFIEYIRDLFKAPSPEAMALKELEDAKRSLLQAQTGAEYANALIKYNTDRVKRLTLYLNEAIKCDQPKS